MSFLEPYATRHGGDGNSIIFWPEDFISYFLDLAEAAGINLNEIGVKLDPGSQHPEYVLAAAFRTLCEIEGIYIEVPNACVECRITRAFLITLASAMIGIATHQATKDSSYLAGALSGVGSLLVSILANRYTSTARVETDWLEELVLRPVEQSGRQTLQSLYKLTHIETVLLRKVVGRLVEKKLLVEIRHWSEDRDTEFDLAVR